MKCDYFSEILKIKTSIKALLNVNNVSYTEITQKDRELKVLLSPSIHFIAGSELRIYRLEVIPFGESALKRQFVGDGILKKVWEKQFW